MVFVKNLPLKLIQRSMLSNLRRITTCSTRDQDMVQGMINQSTNQTNIPISGK